MLSKLFYLIAVVIFLSIAWFEAEVHIAWGLFCLAAGHLLEGDVVGDFRTRVGR